MAVVSGENWKGKPALSLPKGLKGSREFCFRTRSPSLLKFYISIAVYAKAVGEQLSLEFSRPQIPCSKVGYFV